MGTGTMSWRFPKVFWVANSVEMFERCAYYGTFIALALFLTDTVGFSDIWAGWIGAGFSALIYLLPFLTGAAADRMGFRRALMLAFALLAAGYATVGFFPHKAHVLVGLVLVAAGGAFVKPIITGTVAKSSDDNMRARAYSIFYMVVNIGSFTGKTFAKPIRVAMGLDHIPMFSAACCVAALVVVAIFYRPTDDTSASPRSVRESFDGMAKALTNVRFVALILITAGFWAIQGQLYASMPKYVIRMMGESASPEWYANVNPLVVVMLVVPLTHFVSKIRAITSIGISLFLIPLSALVMSFSHSVESSTIHLLGAALPTVTLFMVLGIALQGLAECFLSPRYLEFSSKQAPKGQEGLYLGYAHLNTFFAWLAGFAVSGYLLEAFCPDPKKLSVADQAQRLAAISGNGPLPAAYQHAHYIWYFFSGIGFAALLALIIFQWVTRGGEQK